MGVTYKQLVLTVNITSCSNALAIAPQRLHLFKMPQIDIRLGKIRVFMQWQFRIVSDFHFNADHELILWLTTAHPWLIKYLLKYRQSSYLKDWLLFKEGQWTQYFKPTAPLRPLIPKACWKLPYLSEEEYFKNYE